MSNQSDNQRGNPSRSIDGLVSHYITNLKWEYEDQLPYYEHEFFDEIFPASQVIHGVRMYPYAEDRDGNRLWLSSLG